MSLQRRTVPIQHGAQQHFATKDQARREVAGFIDRYNHRRRHSSAEMLAPVAYEAVLVERARQATEHDEPRDLSPADGVTAAAGEKIQPNQQLSTISGEAQSTFSDP